MREKHLSIMMHRRQFQRFFGVDISQFYVSVFVGFDLIKFDDWLRREVEAYKDTESMSEFITRQYGSHAAELIRSLI